MSYLDTPTHIPHLVSNIYICIYQTLSGIKESRALFTCPACDQCDPHHCPLPWSPANCDSVSGKLFISLLWELRKAETHRPIFADVIPLIKLYCMTLCNVHLYIYEILSVFLWKMCLNVMSCDILTTLTRKNTRMWGNMDKVRWGYENISHSRNSWINWIQSTLGIL